MDSKKHKKQKERTKSHSDSPGSTNGKPIEQDRRGSQSQQPSVTLSPRKKSTNAESRLNDGNSNAGLSPPELVFYVVGGDVVGKSTFIRCALDLKKSNLSPVACKKMSLEGEVFLINLLEMPLSSVDVTDQVVTWPGSVGDVEVSRPDGVLALYDVTDKRSMSQVPMLLNACAKSSTPCVLVACKCDLPLSSRQINPREVEVVCMDETGFEAVQTSIDAPDTHKRCISIMLRGIMLDHSVIARSNGTTRPRAMTATQVSTNFRSYTPKAKHGRAASELTTSSRVTHSEPLAGALPVISFKRDASATVSDDSINHFSGEQDFDATWRYIQSSESVNRDAKYGDDLQEATTTILQPFFDIKSEYPEDLNGEQIKGTIDRVDYSVDKNASPAGHTFDELVDRLLSQQMSKADSKFVAAFLCLYRKFAAPAELLATIFRRFEALNQNDEPMLLRISSQLRHLTILAQWVSEYPGDFAHPLTHQQMTEFIKQNAGNRLFAAAASEMSAQLEVVTEDDDTQWACSDKSRGRASTLESFSSVPSMRSSIAAMIADKSLHDNSSLSIKSQDGVKDRLTRHSKTPSSASSLDRSTSLSGSSMLTVMNSVEAAQRQAELLTPITRTPLTKVQWHYFMEFGDEEVAREMTRIDWIMYSSIRPRDLIRHVSLPVDQKQKCKSLEHVNRMIDQFNHVAFWVANMILLRDKPKHRAKALEKFMGIAWKLRQLNNYNALGAVIAGVNGTAVHRLAQTRDLVLPQAQKDFMRLEILMGTQKSHFAYRLAWENTLSERIPFLPLHRRDMVAAEEGNRTFLGDGNERINWKKFNVMGDVVVGIQASQGTPYPQIPRNSEIQRLILDGKFVKDEDDLFERSLQVEGPAANEPRRRFNWFQR